MSNGSVRKDRIAGFLAEDHARLDDLLRAATADPSHVDHEAYDRFRSGLLRHIGMEEKILLPAIQRLCGGAPLPIAAQLRLDHGALASLLMPTPTLAVLAAIRAVLAAHNQREEGAGGLYEMCQELAGAEAGAILARLREAPAVAVMPHSDSPAVMMTVRNACARAGYAFGDPSHSSEQLTANSSELFAVRHSRLSREGSRR